jgi:proline dehydrogenase
MALMRTMLLAASQNIWLREHAVKYPFVKRSVSRFMPGETLEDALTAAQSLRQKGVGSVCTHLGENVADRNEARQVTEHYLQVLDRIHQSGLGTEVSVKLTQLGLDLSTISNRSLAAKRRNPRCGWIWKQATMSMPPSTFTKAL